MIKQLLIIIGRFVAILCPQYIVDNIKSAGNIIYTGYKYNLFKELGNYSKLARPSTIIGGRFISVGKNVYLGSHCYLSAFNDLGGGITIGDNCMLGSYNHITCCNNINIGFNLRTGSYVLISDNAHGNPLDNEMKKFHPNSRPLYSKGPIIIGNNVWIGDKAAILGGVTIGDGAIIGANSVVTHDVPSNCIAVGCPARIIPT